jgi:hypothetical protein
VLEAAKRVDRAGHGVRDTPAILPTAAPPSRRQPDASEQVNGVERHEPPVPAGRADNPAVLDHDALLEGLPP